MALTAVEPAQAVSITPVTDTATGRSRPYLLLSGALATVLLLAVVSMFVGVSDVSLPRLAAGDQGAWEILWISRIPRTLSVILAGAALAIAGLIMQQMARNRFVEPSMVGTVESATLGILIVTVALPAAPIIAKMGVAAVFALIGTWIFLSIINRLPTRNTLLVPLVGIMLGGVIAAVTTFFAYRHDLLQTLNTWMIGDFSGVLRGRYELLWLVAAMTLAGYLAADRFTVAGMGADFTTNLGLNYRAIMRLGMTIVALITAVVVVTVGAIPFLGLVVPNLVSMIFGDNLRRAVPWTALFGAGIVLLCDIVGRTIRYPYEVPVSMVMGVVGATFFLGMLLHRRRTGAL
ncbi:ABC transporter permease [Jonesia denitrificans]|uniref:Transport system permease protein n=1 Tax=Jonesia denitrificans (strain ATCC 14870 / DSM 20603 / BCRC 15368 / CIP 55.134 / JCM 11481 / NBRC 15587 / NCTC 10816 / Prevot 55134) TaxID=471856 RepID=C7R2L0_JONDD|nr:ABC transporter permease [Jonesia denitrificans]ACV10001.1 transport system permease protein [Jonesia denitrificans DSM 20603]ASE08765.1 iron ABC transporter permease [Jonesia denitrificans]QXB43369.1 ABC transporter permease [Jonesia denitrificans]SQH22781.1 Iron-uptake system permease protein FeuB [Jonesia denitrificans]